MVRKSKIKVQKEVNLDHILCENMTTQIKKTQDSLVSKLLKRHDKEIKNGKKK